MGLLDKLRHGLGGGSAQQSSRTTEPGKAAVAAGPKAKADAARSTNSSAGSRAGLFDDSSFETTQYGRLAVGKDGNYSYRNAGESLFEGKQK